MQHNRMAAVSFAAGIAVWLVGPLPIQGEHVTFAERVISTTADGAHSVFAADVDGDGNTDVLSASFLDDKIAWYESDGGSPPSFTERVISTTAVRALSIFATDVDGDGDADVLSASRNDDKIAWYENDGGSPPSFTLRVISTSANGARASANLYSLVMTCRANDINPYYYFRHLFTELPKRNPEDDMADLMPWNVDCGEEE